MPDFSDYSPTYSHPSIYMIFVLERVRYLASLSYIIKHPDAEAQLLPSELGALAEPQLVYFHVTLGYCPCDLFLDGKEDAGSRFYSIWKCL